MPTAAQFLSATYPPPTLAAQPLPSASLMALGFLMQTLGSWPRWALADRVGRWLPLLIFGGAGYAPLPTFPGLSRP